MEFPLPMGSDDQKALRAFDYRDGQNSLISATGFLRINDDDKNDIWVIRGIVF